MLAAVHLLYRYLAKPILFRFDPENVHVHAIALGEFIGNVPFLSWVTAALFSQHQPMLSQTVRGMHIVSPIGLAAGFDYEARLTQVLPDIGFGFGTIGTITNRQYEGNARPRLGRLPRSRSLLVNKGFKNLGIDATLARLRGQAFRVPVGLSIGVTNSAEIRDQQTAIADIANAFRNAQESSVPFGYYELNISCPNLLTPVEFYSPRHLRELLTAVTLLTPSKPLFIKMPIDKSDEQTFAMLDVIADYPVAGIIFGNLQKNRQDPALVQEEVARLGKGNFSGKPTEKRSNELIALAYKNYGSKLTVVGCGGVFSAEDAYRKIRLGASLVQLITGMIFEGPQLIAEINHGRVRLIKHDGFTNVSEAVGIDVR